MKVVNITFKVGLLNSRNEEKNDSTVIAYKNTIINQMVPYMGHLK